MTFEGLILILKNLAVVQAFYSTIIKGIKYIKSKNDFKSIGSVKELKENFFNDWLTFGDKVKLNARLSQYSPIYFPIAYSPQVIINNYSQDNFKMHPEYNPTPTSIGLRSSDGSALCFLFNAKDDHTPRLTSKYHLDRTSEMPYGLSEESLPILIDLTDLKHTEKIVNISGTIIPLDTNISKAIESSDDDMVKLFYHSFYNSDFFPSKGFMIDARAQSMGEINTSSIEPLSFYTSISIETKIKSGLSPSDIEEIIKLNFKNINPRTPPGR